MKIRRKITIKGIVQGVGFRYLIKSNANSLDVKGYVKNKNNHVEVVAEGEYENVKRLINVCKKGPLLSKVESVDVKIEKYVGNFKSFEIIF